MVWSPPDVYPHVNSWMTTRIPFRFVVFIAVAPDPETGPYVGVTSLRSVRAWGLSANAACERVRVREGITEALPWLAVSP